MESVWFFLLSGMLAVYVLLDGFDFGAGVLHLFVAKTPAERDQVLRSIGPVWDGNEVWLVAAGGTLLAIFPQLYAVTFSGFYLPLMIVLWLLLFRALGIELQHQLHDRMWTQFWDVAFSLSSALLAVFFGAALGNMVRGVSLDESGNFFAPLWTDFSVAGAVGVLDWYTLLVAALSLVALTLHGANWLAWRTDGEVQARTVKLVRPLALAAAVLTAAVTAATFSVQPQLAHNLADRPWGILFVALSLVGLVSCFVGSGRGKWNWSFAGSSTFLFGLVMSATFGIYPNVLPARDPQFSLTLQSVSAAPETLAITLRWWIPGMLIACAYTWFNYSRLPLPTPLEGEHE